MAHRLFPVASLLVAGQTATSQPLDQIGPLAWWCCEPIATSVAVIASSPYVTSRRSCAWLATSARAAMICQIIADVVTLIGTGVVVRALLCSPEFDARHVHRLIDLPALEAPSPVALTGAGKVHPRAAVEPQDILQRDDHGVGD